MDRGAVASRSGRTTFERYSSKQMAEIGANDFQPFTERYFHGDRQQDGERLGTQAHEKRIESFVDRRLARRLDNGEKTVCEEIPCLSGSDDRIPF
jgi:hypothetical protein